MDDLTMTRLCAEAMGFHRSEDIREQDWFYLAGFHYPNRRYDPLRDDAQAMALLRWLIRGEKGGTVTASVFGFTFNNFKDQKIVLHTLDKPSDLNRTIVECIAKMQASKKEPDHA